jgi:hypothetical protein
MRQSEVLHGGRFLMPGEIIQQTRKSAEKFQQVHALGEIECQEVLTHGTSSWLAPTQGWVKANWDAALDSKLGRMGYGALVHDHIEHMRAAHCMTQQGFLPLAAAKARAALMAIQLCMEMGFSQIHLEGDEKGVIKVVRDNAENYS